MSEDPHYKREKQKYANPVASREHLLSLLNELKKPQSFLEICKLVSASDEDSRIGIQRRLRAMEREGQLIFNRQKKYAVVETEHLIKGRVIGHRDGFGFLKREDGEKDLFLSDRQMQTLLHDDVIYATHSGQDRKGRPEGRLVKVITPREEPIVGRFHQESGMGVVVPDDSRICHEIIVQKDAQQGARQGSVVVVELTQRPRRNANGVGQIVEVLGEHMAPGMEIEMALRTFDIPHSWPKAVTRYVKGLDADVPEQSKSGRVDLRDMPLVTIDGEDARDFDDAVYCEPLDDGGWQLWVAIADVSSYVKVGTALDQEAQNRGNSVYFPEQVIPMLPEVLSNGLCSLNPEVDRLCMVSEMTISKDGQLGEFQFYEAVMNSKARFTYTKVWDILQGDAELNNRYADFVPHLRHLYDFYRASKKARSQRGAIEFETQENKFVFNAQRKIEHIIPIERNDAHKLIEECMVMANVASARLLEQEDAFGLFRVHGKPKSERLSSFTSYLREVSIAHNITENATPADFRDVLNKVAGRVDQDVIQTMLLRSMQQAVYDYENIGHFGLALEAYAHFTSPIRRYPDLVVHRAIKAIIKKKQKQKVTGAKAYSQNEVEQLGEQCSMTERRADDATRDVADWLKCEFMQDHVGDTFDGVIASVTAFGFFVRLNEFHIDGLVHITSLQQDYFRFDDVKQCLTGEASGVNYRLGDPVEIKVVAVNLDERKIDFMVVGSDSDARKKKSRRRKTGKPESEKVATKSKKVKKSSKARKTKKKGK